MNIHALFAKVNELDATEQHKKYFNKSEKRDLARIFKIHYREMMGSADKRQVLEFLRTVTDFEVVKEHEKEMAMRPVK